jgi:hypothetical protein
VGRSVHLFCIGSPYIANLLPALRSHIGRKRHDSRPAQLHAQSQDQVRSASLPRRSGILLRRGPRCGMWLPHPFIELQGRELVVILLFALPREADVASRQKERVTRKTASVRKCRCSPGGHRLDSEKLRPQAREPCEPSFEPQGWQNGIKGGVFPGPASDSLLLCNVRSSVTDVCQFSPKAAPFLLQFCMCRGHQPRLFLRPKSGSNPHLHRSLRVRRSGAKISSR